MKLFLDLDGVVADFVGAACVFHNRPLFVPDKWDFYEDWGYTHEDFWHPIRQLGVCFYKHHVRPYPWAGELVKLLREQGGFTIATVAGGGHADDYAGKVLWAREHIGDEPVIVLPKGHKQLLAKRRRLLIDDSDENVAAFRASGGDAITWPQPWNKARCCMDSRLDYVKERLWVITNIRKATT